MTRGVKRAVPWSTMFSVLAMMLYFTYNVGKVLSVWAFPSQKLQEQDELAEQLKGRLRWEQRELRFRLEQLQRGSERMRNDSQGSTMSSERSDSDRGRPLQHKNSLISCTVFTKLGIIA